LVKRWSSQSCRNSGKAGWNNGTGRKILSGQAA
jgi:hypothetical protein